MQEQIDVRESVKARMRIESLSLRDVARACESSVNTVHRFVRGSNVKACVLRRFTNWLSQYSTNSSTAVVRSGDGDFQIIVRKIR